VTALTYDDANKPLSESYGGGILDGLSLTWAHNNSLQRASLDLGGITGTYSVTYGYSLAGRLQTVNQGDNGAVYSYLANSPLVSQIEFTNSGTTRMTTTKQYDRLNRLQAITSVSPVQPVAGFSYLYNNANQRIRATLTDGSYWLYTFDNLGQVISGKRFWQDGTPVTGQQYEYGFDDIGNRKSTGMGGDANWGPLRPASYYTPNRLNQYSQRDVPAAVDISGFANPTAPVTVNGYTAYRKGEYFDYALSTPNGSAPWYNTVTVHSAYGAGQTESGSLFVPQNQEHFYYDADGNLTNDGRWTFTWDAENRLVKLAPNTSAGPRNSIKFEYDGQGRRIHKQVWANTTWTSYPTNDVKFVYDGWSPLAELNGTNNAVIRSCLWGSDLSGSFQGAGGVGGLLEVTYIGAQTTNCFVAFDGNGNVAAVVDAASGSLLAQYEYGPFGEVIRATGPMAKANHFRFSTKYQDDETDLLYYGYRYYNASTGRWLSRDPSDEGGGINLYALVGNDPLDNNDGCGLDGSGSPSPQPAMATRSVTSQRRTSNFGICQFLIKFDLKITDASNKPIPGVTVSESIVIIQRDNLISGPPGTGSGATDSKGSVTDTYYASFWCLCSKGSVSLKQNVIVGTKSATFYTTMNSDGTWTGSLRTVFH
jgi:RHS repeat-associated protein